jgi:hypothetical protein
VWSVCQPVWSFLLFGYLMMFAELRLHSISWSHFFFILPQSERYFWQSCNTVYLKNISLLCMSVIKQTCYSHETLKNIKLKKNTLKCTAACGYCVAELPTTQTMGRQDRATSSTCFCCNSLKHSWSSGRLKGSGDFITWWTCREVPYKPCISSDPSSLTQHSIPAPTNKRTHQMGSFFLDSVA